MVGRIRIVVRIQLTILDIGAEGFRVRVPTRKVACQIPVDEPGPVATAASP